MENHSITLEQASGDYAVCRLDAHAAIPAWADGAGFVTISRSAHELSIVCLAERVPAGTVHEGGWTCLRFVGPFAFGATGIVLSVVRPLSEGKLGVFVVSTFDGDHLLVKTADLPEAIRLLGDAGHVLTLPDALAPYLQFDQYIDGNAPAVAAKAAELAAGCTSDEAIVASCFRFVRDEIRHSVDFGLEEVTCSASAVLEHGSGLCYAKSHLLAALLRANGIPTALCYQRLAVGAEGPPFCLHGLNAVHLENHGWYRIDARGNKPGMDARFLPPSEMLAYPALTAQERDLPELWAAPLPQVVEALSRCGTIAEVARSWPDIALLPQR